MKRLLTITILTILTLASAQQAVAQGMKAQRFRGIQLIGPTTRNNTSEKNQGVALLAPPGLTSSYSLVLPNTNGSAGQSLIVSSVDGSNAAFLTWTTPLTSASGWVLAGNAIATPSTQFLGTTNAQPLVIRTNNIEALRVTSDGEVLIGTSTDAGAYDLQVSGDAYVAGKIAINTNGETQLISTFRAAGSPGGNIFIGAEQTPTWAVSNQGSYNTSLGSLALDNLTSGYMNTAIGRSAMTAITTGYWNTALGYLALSTATDATLNVAIGSQTMRYATGNNNIAMGGYAMQSGTGYNNIAIGTYAASNATITGNDNVALGFRAFDELTSGAQNVIIGSTAARLMTATNQSVILGAASNPSADGTTNEIVIGYGATGLGSNSVLLGNGSITATRLQGRVGVGMSPTGASNVTGLFVRAGSSQSTNTLFEVQNNAGTALVSIGSDGAITGTGGATLTGTTAINTTGTSATTIGNTAASTAVTINTGSSGGLTLGNIQAGTASDDVMLINSSNVITRTTRASLFSNSGWALAGNSITDATTQFLGTTSAQPLVFRTNNTEKLRVTSDGNVGIGDATPSALFTVGAGDLFQVNSSGAIAAAAGITAAGTISLNTTGTAATTIGNTSASTAVAINAGSTGRLKIGGLPVQASTNDDIVLINGSDQVSRITKSNLVNSFGWGLTGNSSLDSTTSFLGTTDESPGRPLVMKTDGVERARITGGNGYVGIGTAVPDVSLEVNGAIVVTPDSADVSPTSRSITVGNRSFIVVKTNGTPALRGVTLSNGRADGHRVTLLIISSNGTPTDGIDLNPADANLKLSGTNSLLDSDVIELIWYGTNWYEVSRSANGD